MGGRKVEDPGLTHLRVTFSDDFYMGPGRADLLELIAQTGSIAAAGRKMDMSYRRAWALVKALNEGFGVPLVSASRGGAEQGAQLTAQGAEVLKAYRRMQKSTAKAIEDDMRAITKLMQHG